MNNMAFETNCGLYRNILSFLKKYSTDKFFCGRCLVTFLLFGIFIFHCFDFSVAFDSKTVPAQTRIFYAKRDFSENNSFILNSYENNTRFFTDFLLKKFRLDIDDNKYPWYDVKNIRINNRTYSGKKLFEILHKTNYLRPELVGDTLRLHLNPPTELKAGETIPLEDYYVSFKAGIFDALLDFFGYSFFLKLILFGVPVVFMWYPSPESVKKRIINKIRNFLWLITPGVLLTIMLGAFLLLRPVLHRFPESEKMFFMFRSDVDISFFILACIMICCIFRHWIVFIVAYLALVVMYAFCFADCFVFFQFNTRVCVIESVNWIGNLRWTFPIVWRSFSTHFAYIELIILVSVTLLMPALYFQNKKRRIGLFIFCSVIAVAGIIFRILPGKNNLFELETKNVFAYGMSQKMYIPYTEKYLKTVKPFQLNYQQEQGKALNRNIILLVVESLSSFQSKYFSGLDIDNMPNFDREMCNASAVSAKFLASSYNTTANTFALLTGFSPLHSPGIHFDYNNEKYYRQTLPQIYRKHGYETVFLSPAKMVDFIDVVVKNSKFDKIIGDDDPFYADAERQVFNSVSDEILLDRLVEYVKTASEDKKYFVYAQTIAMHAPYFDHRTKEYSYAETVKTFDIYFPEFMKKLESAGFFKNNGVLVVTGDHRAMVTIETDEQKEMGFFTT